MKTEELEKKLKINEKTCIHCQTLELAKQVLNIFHQIGLRWNNGTSYELYHNGDAFKGKTLYYPFEGGLSALGFANLTGGYKVINAEEFIALHTEEEEFDLENYEPKGELEGFPKEIIARMLEYQEEQGNPRDISVFEKNRTAGEIPKGFVWWDAEEDYDFWDDVISNKNFNLFFEKYPKKQEIKVCSKCHKEKSLSEFHKRGNTVRPECKECRKQDYQELKNNKNMQENNKKEDNPQDFRINDKVYDILLKEVGVVQDIDYSPNIPYRLSVEFKSGFKSYTINGLYLPECKNPQLLHYRDNYDYSIIDFNNLPKRQEPKRWRAEKEGEYYYIRFYIEDWFYISATKEYNSYYDNINYYSGNYFQTKEEAQEMADKLNEYFQELINPTK